VASKYLRAIAERRLKDGEVEFDRVSLSLDDSEWNKGYLKALEGLLITFKTNNSKHLYLQRKELEDQKIKKKFKEEIKKHSINELHADYDRGFFSALLDYFTITEQRKSSRRSK
jgi:C4-type Zn-finger protein